MAKKDRIPEPCSFRELVDEQAALVHSDLLEFGGKGLKQAVYHAMVVAMDWDDKKEAYEKQQGKLGKKKD